MKDWQKWGLGVGMGLGGIGAWVALASFYKDAKVEPGYIPPSHLEVKVEDLEGDGQPETILKVNNKQYLLMYENEKPVLYEYQITPTKTTQSE